MEENVKEVKKLSYEELENVAAQLSQQVQRLSVALRQSEVEGVIKRLEMLFKVLEYNKSFTEEFVQNCAQEIEAIITPREALEEANTNEHQD
jgi:hypothetical protein